MSAARKRVIDWDVDGLSVWCDAPGCTNQERCESCELAAESEELDWYSRSCPMVNLPQSIALKKRCRELLAEAARLDALAMEGAPCEMCGFETEVTREQTEFGETPLCVECDAHDRAVNP